MKKSKHTEEQIIGVLKQMEAGRTVKEVGTGAGRQRSDDLHLEEQSRRYGGERGATS